MKRTAKTGKETILPGLFFSSRAWRLISLAALLSACQEAPRLDQPNIILVIGDDHGYPYFGFMGADYVHTPAMDDLATSGALFTQGYVSSNHCRPSLATLVTGLDPIVYRKRVAEKTIQLGLSEEAAREFGYQAMQYFETLPKLLDREGYRSFQAGKWWEFHFRNGGFTDGMTTGWTQEDRKSGEWFKKFMGGDGLALARETLEPVFDFIEAGSDPFFIWFAPELPHYPFDAPQRLYDLYAGEDMSESARLYYANCTWFDESVGALMHYLQENDLYENTLIIYVNDNGWEQQPEQEFVDDPMRSHNGGDKGKSSIYDLSFRTPIIFSWPGTIDPLVNEMALVHSADIPATILDLVSSKVPGGMQGKSLKHLLLGGDGVVRSAIWGDVTSTRDESSVMGVPTEGYWMREDQWFLRWDVTRGDTALYNLSTDWQNNFDLKDSNPEQARKMLLSIENWRDVHD